MATSFFFNNFSSSMEQTLIENLIIESIKIHGYDVYYLPRELTNLDEIYGEDSVSIYNSSYFLEMYIKDISGFRGEGDFLSKFNLQIRDQITFTVARRVFYDEVGNIAKISRPQEGDLIYFPLNKKLFIIKFVEHESIFYQLGALQTFDLQCELWEYSNERFNTGIPDIDANEALYSFDHSNYAMLTEDSFVIQDESGFDIIQERFDFTTQVGDAFEDNTEIEQEASAIINFTESDPFSEGNV